MTLSSRPGRPRLLGAWPRALALVLVLGALGLAAGLEWGHRQSEVHQAAAVVLINPLVGNPFSPDGRGNDLINLETEAQLVVSDRMGELVAAGLGDPDSAQQVLDQVQVSVPPNTQLLRITSSAGSDVRARRIAQGFAEGYLDSRRAVTGSAIFDQTARLSEQIVEHTRERRDLARELGNLREGSPRAALASQQLRDLNAELLDLGSRRAELSEVALDPGQVVTPAISQAAGRLGAPSTTGAVGLLLGVGLGLSLAVGLARVDDVIRDPATLAGALPVVVGDPLVVLPRNRPGHASTVTRLRAAVLAADAHRPLVVLASSGSVEPTEERPTSSLARALAATRLHTVLVDVAGADPSTVAADDPGLTDLLLDRATIKQVTHSPAEHLTVLGPGPGSLDDLAGSPEMAVLLQELLDEVDVLLLQCGPLSEPATQALATQAHLLLLEVHGELTTWPGLRTSVADLDAVGAPPVRVVYVEPPARGLRSRLATRLRLGVRLPTSLQARLGRRLTDRGVVTAQGAGRD